MGKVVIDVSDAPEGSDKKWMIGNIDALVERASRGWDQRGDEKFDLSSFSPDVRQKIKAVFISGFLSGFWDGKQFANFVAEQEAIQKTIKSN